MEQTISSAANDYIFELDGHILHYNVSGQVGLGEDVYADGQHIALYSGGTVFMSHTDQVGSIRKWTIYNSGGYWTSQGTFSNLPFGDAQTTNSGAGVADHDFFGGFIQDPDGEFASPTRRLSATQAHWQVPDPAGLAAVDPSNPQTWNRYAYVSNNPVSFTDPSGLCDINDPASQCPDAPQPQPNIDDPCGNGGTGGCTGGGEPTQANGPKVDMPPLVYNRPVSQDSWSDWTWSQIAPAGYYNQPIFGPNGTRTMSRCSAVAQTAAFFHRDATRVPFSRLMVVKPLLGAARTF